MTPDKRTGPTGEGPVGERRDAASQFTADPRLQTRCAPCAEDATALASQYTALGVPVPPALARLADLTDCTKERR